MAKYDHGGGCPCGLYAECIEDCQHYTKGSTASNAFPKQTLKEPEPKAVPKVVSLDGRPVAGPETDKTIKEALLAFYNLFQSGQIKTLHMIAMGPNGQLYTSLTGMSDLTIIGALSLEMFKMNMAIMQNSAVKDIHP